MSTLKVDTILKRTGTGTIAIGQSGDTVDITSGSTLDLTGTTVSGLTGAGKILQVQTSTYATATTTTSSTLAATGLTGSITPSATSSKIFLSLTFRYGTARSNNGGKDDGYGIRITSGAGTVLDYDNSGTAMYFLRDNAVSQETRNIITITGIDSPSTTSAITYTVKHAAYQAAGVTGTFCRNNATATLTLMEIGA
tara:strand:+ start:84 stop:671 length:588 start_codon:yes stop_codon:yes gene_type:complete